MKCTNVSCLIKGTMHMHDDKLLKDNSSVSVPVGISSAVPSLAVLKCDTSELSSSIVDSYDSCSEESDEDEDVDFEYDSSSDEDVPLDSEVEFAKTLHVT